MSSVKRKLVLTGRGSPPRRSAAPSLVDCPVGPPARAGPDGAVLTGPEGRPGPRPSHRREAQPASPRYPGGGPHAPPRSAPAGADPESAAELAQPHGARGD